MRDEAIFDAPAEDKGAPKWVVTFGDLMSLLLCFFVLLLSFSEMDRQKYKMVAGSLKQAFGVQRKTKTNESPKGATMVAMSFDQDLVPKFKQDEYIAMQTMEALGEELKKALEGKLKGLENQVEIEVDGNQTVIRLQGGATFDSGKARIRPRLIPVLEEIGYRLKGSQGDIIIAGHTDNVPLRGGLYGPNLGLSMARAGAVAEFLLKTASIDPKRLSTMGFGEYRPIDTNDTAAGRQRNRRVEIILGTIPTPENR